MVSKWHSPYVNYIVDVLGVPLTDDECRWITYADSTIAQTDSGAIASVYAHSQRGVGTPYLSSLSLRILYAAVRWLTEQNEYIVIADLAMQSEMTALASKTLQKDPVTFMWMDDVLDIKKLSEEIVSSSGSTLKAVPSRLALSVLAAAFNEGKRPIFIDSKPPPRAGMLFKIAT